MAEHTPGPWRIGEPEPRTGRILIAAAPALADALEAVLGWFQSDHVLVQTDPLRAIAIAHDRANARAALRAAGRLP